MAKKILALIVFAGSVIAITACSRSDQSPQPDDAAGYEDQSTDNNCDLPKCVDETKVGVLPGGKLLPEIVLHHPVANIDYLQEIVRALPVIKRRDEYESTAAFRKRAGALLNDWKLGDFGPSTRVLIASGASSRYDADRGRLIIANKDGAAEAGITGMSSKSDNENYDLPNGSISRTVDSTSSDAIWFTNLGSATDRKADGFCSITYRSTLAHDIKIKVTPDEARGLKEKLRFYYVVTFSAPKSARGGEWCYDGFAGDETNVPLGDGKFYTNRSSVHYLNMHLEMAALSDGSRIFWSRTYL